VQLHVPPVNQAIILVVGQLHAPRIQVASIQELGRVVSRPALLEHTVLQELALLYHAHRAPSAQARDSQEVSVAVYALLVLTAIQVLLRLCRARTSFFNVKCQS